MIDDIDILARTLHGEAKANNIADAEAIASVVMNRCRYPNWPSSPAKVCQQPWQFSCWNTNDPNRERILNAKGAWFDTCVDIATRAVNGAVTDMTATSTHYHTRNVKPFWSKGKQPVFETDGHLFFNDIDTKPPATAKEALDQHRPLNQSRTVRGASLAGAMTVIGPVAGEISSTLEQYTHLSDYIKWACVALGAIGAGYAVWARISDRQAGIN